MRIPGSLYGVHAYDMGLWRDIAKMGQIYNETNFMLVSTSSRMLLRDMRKAQIVVILGAKY